MRDSLHAGVPYGQHFDRRRLIGSLCLNKAGDGLAITDKGKTAAEMMVFARYVMFSEVYWHHAVRARRRCCSGHFTCCTAIWISAIVRAERTADDWRVQQAAKGGPAAALLDGLFGPRRRLYKRLAQYSYFEEPAVYERLARQPYVYLVKRRSGRIAAASARRAGKRSRRMKYLSMRHRPSLRSISTLTYSSRNRACIGRWARFRRSYERSPMSSSTIM